MTYPEDKPLVLSFGYGERAHRTAGERSVREHETDPRSRTTSSASLVAELNVFWPPLVDGMLELTLSPYDGDQAECSDLPDGPSLSVAFFCPGDGNVRIDLAAARRLYDVYNDFMIGYGRRLGPSARSYLVRRSPARPASSPTTVSSAPSPAAPSGGLQPQPVQTDTSLAR